jgi:hypothetical protein
MLENTLREIEYRLDILHGKKGAHIEVVEHSAVLILQVIKLLDYIFIFRKQFNFIFFGLKIIGHGNPDNNLGSACMYENYTITIQFLHYDMFQPIFLANGRGNRGS